MNWYGRRLVLAGIYKTTELYMLSDTSDDHQRTWEFLNRRVDESVQLEGLLANTEIAGKFAKEFAASTFITVSNDILLIRGSLFRLNTEFWRGKCILMVEYFLGTEKKQP